MEESDAVGDASPDWRVSTNFVAVAILARTAAFMLVRTARDALYFQGDGLIDLPKAYLGIAQDTSSPFSKSRRVEACSRAHRQDAPTSFRMVAGW